MSKTRSGRGMRCDEGPLYYRSVSSKGAGRPRLMHHHKGGWNETKWMRWVWRKGGMKFVVWENGRNPVKNLPRPRFVRHEAHMEGPRRELGTPAVGGERLTAYATRPPVAVYRNETQFKGTIYWNRAIFQHIHLRSWGICYTVAPTFVYQWRRSLPPETTLWHSSPPQSFWKRWQDRNFLRCQKRWKSLGARSGVYGGWLHTSQLNSCRRCVDRWAVCGRALSCRKATPALNILRRLLWMALSQTALYSRRKLELKPLLSTVATILLWELGKSP